MKDEIGRRLTELVNPIVPFSYSEAETDGYPYAVYDLETKPTITKDGIHHLTGDVTIIVVSEQYSEAAAIADTIKTKIEQQMNDGVFASYLETFQDTCESGVWVTELKYTIKQYK